MKLHPTNTNQYVHFEHVESSAKAIKASKLSLLN